MCTKKKQRTNFEARTSVLTQVLSFPPISTPHLHWSSFSIVTGLKNKSSCLVIKHCQNRFNLLPDWLGALPHLHCIGRVMCVDRRGSTCAYLHTPFRFCTPTVRQLCGGVVAVGYSEFPPFFFIPQMSSVVPYCYSDKSVSLCCRCFVKLIFFKKKM